MKKKLFILSTMIFAVAFSSKHVVAQSQAQSGNVTVNINLTDAISITLEANPVVDFNYQTAEDYTQEQVVSKPDHFTVVSNKPYDIAVRATGFDGADAPDLDILTIAVDPATLYNGTATETSLSTTESTTPLLSGAEANNGALYNIDYKISDPTSLLNKAESSYTTSVTYTVTQN